MTTGKRDKADRPLRVIAGGAEPSEPEDAPSEQPKRVSAIAVRPPSPVPRLVVFCVLVVAIGAIAWLMTRTPSGADAAAPHAQPTVVAPTAWAATSQIVVPKPQPSGTTSAK